MTHDSEWIRGALANFAEEYWELFLRNLEGNQYDVTEADVECALEDFHAKRV